MEKRSLDSALILFRDDWSTPQTKEGSHLRFLMEKRFKQLHNPKYSHIANQNAEYFGRLLSEVCTLKGISVTKFKNPEEAIMFIREQGGLEDFLKELRTYKSSNILIEQSNSKKSIMVLSKAFAPDQGSLDFEGYKKSVKELRTWIRLVARLRDSDLRSLKAFSGVVRGTTVWRNDKVFMAIFFMAGINEYKNFYTVEDCLKMIDFLERNENWLDIIKIWLIANWGDEGRDIIEHRSFGNIARVLSVPENHCIKSFSSRISSEKKDRENLKEIERQFTSAIGQGERSLLNKTYESKVGMNLVSHFIKKQIENFTLKQTYDFFKRAPYMFSWFDEVTIRRVMLVNKSIVKEAEMYNPDETKKASDWYYKKESFGDFLHEIMYKKNPFDLGHEFLEKNVFDRKPFSPRAIDDELRKSFEIMAENLSFDTFNDWLKLLEKYNRKTFVKLPISLALALYLHAGKDNAPKTLEKEIREQPWFPCITDRLYDLYRKEVESSLSRKNKNPHIIPAT